MKPWLISFTIVLLVVTVLLLEKIISDFVEWVIWSWSYGRLQKWDKTFAVIFLVALVIAVRYFLRVQFGM